ncbi:MAG TPA: hypothetical protein VMH82_11410 [Myxococcota bacterium]|nr:hypothetical protein [Myxococcota bacterium]
MTSPNASEVYERPRACGICGSLDVAIDEVIDRGLWRLGECRRCRDRWTEGPLVAAPARAARAGTPESVAA